jgi:hypothetical protein
MRILKKSVPAAVCLLLPVLAGCGGAGVVAKRFDEKHIVSIAEYRKLDMRQAGEYAACLGKGESFPLALSVNDDNIEIRQKSVDVVLKQRICFLLKVAEDLTSEEVALIENASVDGFMALPDADKERYLRRVALHVSRDAVTWAPLTDRAALRTVLGTKGGSVSFGLGLGKKDGLEATLDITTAPSAQR